MTLVNVRLDEEDARRVRVLREKGVTLSALVREAIRAEYERRVGAPSRRKPSAVVAGILAAIPDDDAVPATRVDTRDRRAVREHIAAKLRRRP